MAKKAERKEVTVQDERAVLGPLTITPARLIDDSVEITEIQGLPAEFADSETMAGFPPSPKFEKKGDTMFGEFIGVRSNIGPNSSRVYELSVPKGNGESFTVAVWGSTAIDRQFDSAYPPVQQGDRIAFIYLGEKATKRAQNPVKLFALKVKRVSQAA